MRASPCCLFVTPGRLPGASPQAASESETYLRLQDGSREEQQPHSAAVFGQLTCAQPFHRAAAQQRRARQQQAPSNGAGGGAHVEGSGAGGGASMDLGALGRKGQLGAGFQSAGPHSQHLLPQ
jgi:hypothetical protein